jgi:hypothetical protein
MLVLVTILSRVDKAKTKNNMQMSATNSRLLYAKRQTTCNKSSLATLSQNKALNKHLTPLNLAILYSDHDNTALIRHAAMVAQRNQTKHSLL